MPNPSDVPNIEPAIIAWLDRVYPVPTITPKSTQNEIMFAAGQRDVLTLLKTHHNQQQQNQRA